MKDEKVKVLQKNGHINLYAAEKNKDFFCGALCVKPLTAGVKVVFLHLGKIMKNSRIKREIRKSRLRC